MIEIISNELGYEVEEMHEVFKYKFLEKTIEDKNGNLIRGYGSTKKINTKEFTNYIDKITKYTKQDLDINLPDSFE